MKALLTISMAFICLSSNAQLKSAKIEFPVDKDSLICYQDIVILKDSTISKDRLFSNTKVWFANTFTNSKSVLQVEDNNAGRLLGKGYSDISDKFATVPTYIKYTIEILVKNGKYRYKFYNLSVEGGEYIGDNPIDAAYKRYLNDKPIQAIFESKKGALKRYENLFIDANKSIITLIASLRKSVDMQDKKDEF